MLIVGRATTCATMKERNLAVALFVRSQLSAFVRDNNGLSLLVGPKGAVTTADGAIASCHLANSTVHLDFDGAAMTDGLIRYHWLLLLA